MSMRRARAGFPIRLARDAYVCNVWMRGGTGMRVDLRGHLRSARQCG